MYKFSFVFTILCIPCLLLSQEEDRFVFEKSLPEADLIVLNELIDFYDLVLSSAFSSDNNAPKELLTTIGKGNLDKIDIDVNRACILMEEVHKSTLLERSAQLKYKSVYAKTAPIGNQKPGKHLSLSKWPSSSIDTKSPSTNKTDTIIVSVNQENDTAYNEPIFLELYRSFSIQEKIALMKSDGYYKLYSISTFERGILNLKNNEFLKGFIEAKSAYDKMGLGYKDIAQFVASSPPADYESYFMKRIIIANIFIPYLEERLKC